MNCSKRKEARERGMELLQAGDKKAAAECFQRAVDVTPRMAFNLIELLRKEGVEFVVAPYEADAQLTYMCLNGLVDAVISEDSDLIPYGCPRMIYKLDKEGNGKEVQFSDLGSVTELDLSRFSAEMLRHMCILSGCDYLESLSGMGLKKAHSLLQRHGTMGEVFRALENSKFPMPENYALDFGRADLTFQHQIVYDPVSRKTVHLHPLPDDVDPSTLPFAGEHLSDVVAQLVADGRIDPSTFEPFMLSIPIAIPDTNTFYVPPSQMGDSGSNTSQNRQIGYSSSISRPGGLTQSGSMPSNRDSQTGTTQPLSQLSNGAPASSTPTRLSTSWQSKSLSPLSALQKSSSASSNSPARPARLSHDEIARHDNLMTRDAQKYVMYRGSGKGMRAAVVSASNVISTISKPINTLHAYFSTSTPKKSSSTTAESPNAKFSSPTRLPSTPSSQQVFNSPSSSALATPEPQPAVLRSRFFSQSSSMSYTLPSPQPPTPVALGDFSSIWDDDCIELDDATEALIAQASSARSKTATPLRNSTSVKSPTSPREVKSPRVKNERPASAEAIMPARFSLPPKAFSMSINDESDEELELVPVASTGAGGTWRLERTTATTTEHCSDSHRVQRSTRVSAEIESADGTSAEIQLASSSTSLVLSDSAAFPASLVDYIQYATTHDSCRASVDCIPEYEATHSSPTRTPNLKKRGRVSASGEAEETEGMDTSPPIKVRASEINIFSLIE